MQEYIIDFLDPVSRAGLSGDAGYREGQIGYSIALYEEAFPDLEEADIVLIGCGEQRGAGALQPDGAPDAIRAAFYNLYHWHLDLKLADLGNVKSGRSTADTYAALKMVLRELQAEGKLVVVLGGSHDLTLAQYGSFAEDSVQVEGVGVDAQIDLNLDSPFKNENFLMELLTAEPNYLRHYSHVAFQSYLVHPRMLETMDKLRFDCFRTGAVQEHIEEMEPVLRAAHFLSFDLSAIAPAYAPANTVTPNGLTGAEACTLLQYAGMSPRMASIGLYGYRPGADREGLTAAQLAQMLWYLMDGRSRGLREADTQERSLFNEFHLHFAEVETLFLQSKKTGRWWMQLPDGSLTPCSERDYRLAAANEMPERWLRAQERLAT